MTCADATGICVQAWQAAPVAAVAAAALLAAFLESPSPRHRRRPRLSAALTLAGGVLFIASGALAACGLVLAGTLACAGGLSASASAIWSLRDRAPEHPDDGGSGPHDDGPPGDAPAGGIDWEAFERDFADYARSRVPVG